MASTSPRIVVTGLGATTPLGGDVPSTWDAALAGRSGARTLTQDWVAELEIPVTFAASVAVNPIEQLARVETRRLDPCGQYALAASREAWADAGKPEIDPERLGVVIATGIGGVWTLLDSYDTLKTKGPRRVFPLTVPDAHAQRLGRGRRHRARRPRRRAHPGQRLRVRRRGHRVRRGHDPQRPGRRRRRRRHRGGHPPAAHLRLRRDAGPVACATRPPRPPPGRTTCRATASSSARAPASSSWRPRSTPRPAAPRIYAEIAGSGLTSDGFHIAAPEPEGLGAGRAMKLALEAAGASPSEVVHLNAHATSTPVGDTAEAKAIRLALGSATDNVAVSATKSMTGHLLGAAGALESIFTILAVYHRQAPPTINVEDLDPEIDLDVVRKDPRPIGTDGQQLVALNNSFGFGGHNVALAVRSA